jgi:four helix bundle protein
MQKGKGKNMERDKKQYLYDFKKRLYAFTLKLIALLDKLPGDNVSRRIGDQLLRSGTSIIGNYVEGQAACSKKDFAKYLHISLKSANESKLWLAILKDTKRIPSDGSKWFFNELEELSKIFASSILTMKRKKG